MIYGEDLAYIHDAGFSGFCLKSAPGLLALMRRAGIRSGLVVDLGSGGGRWAQVLVRAGYSVVGVEQSPAFVRMARRVEPHARFVRASLWDARLPRCRAVTSLGECLNYGGRKSTRVLSSLFRRIYQALEPGGLLIFDAAGPERIPETGSSKGWTEGPDYAVLVESSGEGTVLTRRIVSFRRCHGELWRRANEKHLVRLYESSEILETLRGARFQAQTTRRFGRFRLPQGITGFVANKA